VGSFAVAPDDKVDLQRLSYRFPPAPLDKVGSFTPTYNATEQLSSFMRE
jgi:hypothetical protein